MRAALLAFAACGRLGFATEQPVPIDTTLDVAVVDAIAPPAGLVAHWPMNEAAWAGTAIGGPIDATGHGHTGNASGGADTVEDPVRGRVGNFVGDPSCVTVADAPELRMTTAVTMSAWVAPAQLSPASFGVISKRTDFHADNEYSLFLWANGEGTGTTNVAYVDIDSEDDRSAAPTVFADGAWHQLTATYDGSRPAAMRIAVFVDGAHVADLAEGSAQIAAPTDEPALRLGCFPVGMPGQSLVGKLSDAALWNRALTAGEAADWYAQTKR